MYSKRLFLSLWEYNVRLTRKERKRIGRLLPNKSRNPFNDYVVLPNTRRNRRLLKRGNQYV